MRKWKSAPEGSTISGEGNTGDSDDLMGATVILTQGYGTIRFIGPTQFASGEWVGVELDGPDGKNDGSVLGVQYFRCPPQRGLFMRRNAIKLASRDNSTKFATSPSDGMSPTTSDFSSPNQASVPRSPRTPKLEKRQSEKRQSSRARKKKNDEDTLKDSLKDRPDNATVEIFLNDIEEVHNAVKRLAVSLQDVEQDGTMSMSMRPEPCGGEVSKGLLQELCAELRRTREDIRRDMFGLMQELRQEFTAIRNEVYSTKKEIQQIPFTAATQIAVSSKADSQSIKRPNDERPLTVNPCSDPPTEEEVAAAIKLQARFRGMAQRWEQRRRKQAAIFIQRKCRARLKTGRVLRSTIQIAYTRHREWLVIFNFWRDHQDGLNEQNFVGAMQQLHRRLVESQCRALYDGVTKHTSLECIDFMTFSAIGEAVSIGDHVASEFADMAPEDFSNLAHQFVRAKIAFKKHRGRN